MDSLSDSSFMIVPFGESSKPYDLCSTMLQHALNTEKPNKTEIFASAVDIIVDALVDGITDELAVKHEWKPSQGNLADSILLSFVKVTREYVIDIFSEKSLSDNGGTDGPLAFAILFFWTLRDKAYKCVEETVNQTQDQLSITKQGPPKSIS